MPAVANLVHETSTSTGTGNLTIAAVNGKQRFSDAFGTGSTEDVFYYFISNRAAAEWERGTGHMSDANTLVRDTVEESSNSNSAVDFSAGTKDIANDIPAASQKVVISPRAYGGVGDGTTDDSAAMQAALAAAEALSDATDSDSILDGVFTEIDCTGATWGIGSDGVQFTTTKNVIIRGGRFKAVGTWASPAPIFNIVGSSDIGTANIKCQDVTIDCGKKSNGIHVENSPRFMGVNIRITHHKEYGIEFGDNVWGSSLYEPVIHEWDSDDAELEDAEAREADGIRINGASSTDIKFIGGFIGFNFRSVAILQGGFGVAFIGTHIYDSALVTPQEHDLVYTAEDTNSAHFIGCYFDTGWVHLMGAGDHIFQNCRFYRNEGIAPTGLTAYIHWEATEADQGILTRLIGNYWQDHSFPIENPIGKFTEDSPNSYAFTKGTLTTAAQDNWIIREPLSITVSSFETDVLALRTFNTNAYLEFEDANTTTPPKIGSEGDDFVIEVTGDVLVNGSPIGSGSLDADLTAIAALAGTGLATRTAADTWAQRTITGTANEITVTNGNGVSGNPTLSLPSALTFTGKTVTGGTLTGMSAVRVINGTDTIQARNAANSANITIAGVDSSDFIRAGAGAGLWVFHAQPVPLADGTVDLGASSLRWNTVYAAVGTISTSDPRLKKDMAPLPPSLAIVQAVEPITFKWKDEVGYDDRTHWGFRAGDIKDAIDRIAGIDCAAYHRAEGGYEGLRSHELIPILWKAVQELAKEVESLKAARK